MSKQNDVGYDENNHESCLRDSFGEIIPKKPNRYADSILAIFQTIPNNSDDKKDDQKPDVSPEQAPGTRVGRSRCLAVAGISVLSIGLFVAVNAPARTELTQTVLPVIGKALAVVAASHFLLPVIAISLACVMFVAFSYFASKKPSENDASNTECSDSNNQLDKT